MRLITNNPSKYGGLDGFGLDIVERVPSITAANPENIKYLRTKVDRMGHILEGLDGMEAGLADAMDTLVSSEGLDDGSGIDGIDGIGGTGGFHGG
jgi:hypothetical protein